MICHSNVTLRSSVLPLRKQFKKTVSAALVVLPYHLGCSDPQRLCVVPPVREILLRIFSDQKLGAVFNVIHVVVDNSMRLRIKTYIQ